MLTPPSFRPRRLKENGSVYLGQFEGWYDQGQEEYYTELKAKELEYKSPVTGKDLVKATEENYYFRLSAFQGRLEARKAKPRRDATRPRVPVGVFLQGGGSGAARAAFCEAVR